METVIQISEGIAVLIITSLLLTWRIVRQRNRARGDGSSDSWSGSSDMPGHGHDGGGWGGDSGGDSGGHGGH